MTNRNRRDEIVARYAAGERSFPGLELDGETMDLRNCNLWGADFSKSYIFADFRDANLQGVSFEHANVKTCDFRGANLRGASFRGALIDAAEFDGADMAGAVFEGATVHSHTFVAGEFPIVDLSSYRSIDSRSW